MINPTQSSKLKMVLLFGFWILFGIWNLEFGISNVAAQTAPEFLVSWRAVNYVPADYLGKVFPSQNSPIEISFNLVDNGKIADLSKNTVSWFVNDQLIQSAAGLKTIRFGSNDADQTIRIKILNYKGGELNHLLIIPVNKPQVIIDARIPQSEIKLGQYNLEARPFFFNVPNANNLIFKWTNNDQLIAGSPKNINLDLKSSGVPSETKINISLSVVSASNQLEFANSQLILTVK